MVFLGGLLFCVVAVAVYELAAVQNLSALLRKRVAK